MITALFSKRYIFTTLLVIAAMAVMIRLGVWQLDRRQQRLAFNADVVAKLEQAPQSLNDALAGAWNIPEDRSEIRNIRASATGVFDYSSQIVLLQQLHEGRPGAHLVVPLVLDGYDEGTPQALLIDRGWIPEESMGDLDQFREEAIAVTVTGLLQPSQVLPGRAAQRAEISQQASPAQTEWYRVDVEAIQGQMPYQLLPVYLLEAPLASGNLTPPIRVQPEFDLSEGSHLNYALQWFSFAAIAGIIYVRIVYTRERKAGITKPTEARSESNTTDARAATSAR